MGNVIVSLLSRLLTSFMATRFSWNLASYTISEGPSPSEQFPQHCEKIGGSKNGNNPEGSCPGPPSLMYGGMLYQLANIFLGHLHFSENQKKRSENETDHILSFT